MADKLNKLELTWIGKENRPRLEPRILLEQPELSYSAPKRVTENDIFDNMLIHGDNLLALKALEQDFAGKVKCVYIDPPYNTGSAFAEYEDGIEHSIWLSLIRERLAALQRLLHETGSIWVHLDDNEAHYAKVLMDEIFGRRNFVGNVIWKKSYAVRAHAEFFSTSHEHILVFAKDSKKLRLRGFPQSDEQQARYDNPDADPRGPWQSVAATISLLGGARGRQFAKTGHSDNIFEVTSPSGKKFLPPSGRCWFRAPAAFAALDADRRLWWGPKADRAPRFKKFLTDSSDEIIATTLWDDGKFFGFNQDGVREIRDLSVGATFPTPKPELLISRVLQLATEPNDLVLDSFLGSGTTAAVAHKMGRRWIGLELGSHAESLGVPRMRRVVDGSDPGGVTEATGWTGGGGFRFYRLAPSLLERDKWGNYVISETYRKGPDAGARLAEAMCKLEGFNYAPSTEHFWLHGTSTERDFLYVTTQNLGVEQVRAISEEVGEERTLLICCGAFRCGEREFPNITLKKIPSEVLAKCEWGKDDYSLNVSAVTGEEADVSDDGTASSADSTQARASTKRGRPKKPQPAQLLPLFTPREPT